MDSGQYNARWRHVHNMPEEAVQAVLDMDGQLLVPIHWGMFTLSMHDWFEPPVRVLAEAARLNVNVLTPLWGSWLMSPICRKMMNGGSASTALKFLASGLP